MSELNASDQHQPDTEQPIKKSLPWYSKMRFWSMVLVVIVCFGIYRIYDHFSTEREKAHKAIPVVLAKASMQDVAVYLNALGNVVPTYSVTVKTQINGTLLNVFYHEGQTVKKGDLLAEIDPRPYQAQLLQYEGQLTRDFALLANARIDLNRYQKLWKEDSISQQTLATQASLVKQDEGIVQIDQGLIDATKVNLIYCEITSPVDGRIGLRLVDPGNVVQTSDVNGIAVINTLNPITVIFTLPEDNIQEVAESMTRNQHLLVDAYDRSQTSKLAQGELLTIDNQIDTSTGTVKLKAQFDNKDNRLFPNQFVNVRMLVNTLKQAIVVPTTAIQYGQHGNFVYVYNEDATVTMLSVRVGMTEGDITVINSGLKAGDAVVVEGADNLTDGAKVTVGDAKKSQVALIVSPRKQRIIV